jgi:hypothetical protein
MFYKGQVPMRRGGVRSFSNISSSIVSIMRISRVSGRIESLNPWNNTLVICVRLPRDVEFVCSFSNTVK